MHTIMPHSNQESSHYQNEPVEPYVIKVSATSKSSAVAGALAGMIREARAVEVQAIGAAAVNQAIKALTIGRSYLERDRIDLMFVPYFNDIEIDGQERTAVRFRVIPVPYDDLD
jgi:stage V sporulation protein S